MSVPIRDALREATRAIADADFEAVGHPDYERFAAAAIRVCADVVRDFPLNICGYGGPMPVDQASAVESFREAVLARLAGDDA